MHGGKLIGRITAPQISLLVHKLMPCDYITSYGKRDFADVTKLRILRWRDYFG